MRFPIPLPLAACLFLALSGCQEEEAHPAKLSDPIRLDLSSLSASAWPDPDLDTSIALGDIDPLTENTMIVLDMSGSMNGSECSGSYGNKAEAAKDVLLAWIAANPGPDIGLVAFSAGGVTTIPLGQGDRHARNLVDTIRSLEPGGKTPLRSAMRRAEHDLETRALQQQGNGLYRMVVITDGEASAGENPSPLVDRIVLDPANMIEIHTIGFCISGGHSLNNAQTVFYTDANSPEDIAAGLAAVQGEAARFDKTFTVIEDISQ